MHRYNLRLPSVERIRIAKARPAHASLAGWCAAVITMATRFETRMLDVIERRRPGDVPPPPRNLRLKADDTINGILIADEVMRQIQMHVRPHFRRPGEVMRAILAAEIEDGWSNTAIETDTRENPYLRDAKWFKLTEASLMKTSTLSLCLSLDEKSLIQHAAEADGMSASRRIASIACHLAHKDQDETVKSWLATMRGRKGLAPRDERLSSVVYETDKANISDAAKRLGATQHAWLQAVAVMSVEVKISPHDISVTPKPEGYQPSNAIDGPSSPTEATKVIQLLSTTLATFLRFPQRSGELEARLRKLAGNIDPAMPLEAHHIEGAALSAVSNVVPIRKSGSNGGGAEGEAIKREPRTTARHPSAIEPERDADGHYRDGSFVVDKTNNKASVETFGSVEAAKQALGTLRDCQSCIDCVSCTNCRSCIKCGECVDCSFCEGIMGAEGVHGVKGNDQSTIGGLGGD